MPLRVKELYETQAAKQAELDALLAKENLSPEDRTRLKALNGELKALDEDIAQAEELVTMETESAVRRERVGKAVTTLPHPSSGGGGEPPPGHPNASTKFFMPIRSRPAAHEIKNFVVREYVDAAGDVKEMSAAEQAERFGMWAIANLSPPGQGLRAKKYCEQRGIGFEYLPTEVKVAYEGVPERGGFTVPPEFDMTLIDLREKYGVFRAYARRESMATDAKLIPRRTGHVTVYPVGEGAAITASDIGFDQIGLVARKWAGLSKRSTELDEDNAVNLGDQLVKDFAWAFGKKEDQAGFLGDGTSTYHGIRGVTQQILALSATRANIAGLVVAAGDLWTEFLLTDFLRVLAILPEYAVTTNTAWYCSRTFYFSTMLRLILAQGGSPGAEVIAGVRTPMFLGFPVHISQAMPIVDAGVDTISCFFGDLDMAASFGDRRGITVAISEHSDFANDLLVLRVTERFDINIHDVGNATSVAADKEPGPIVALVSSATP